MDNARKYFMIQQVATILLAIGIFLLLPLKPYPKKVNFDLIQPVEDGVSIDFADIDNDGKDEQIKKFFHEGRFSIQVIEFGGGPRQYNIICDSSPRMPQVEAIDVDGNDSLEIFCVYARENKIFFDIIFPYSADKTYKNKSFFVDSILTVPGDSPKMQVSNFISTDLNKDGYKEVIFGILSTYDSYYPRKIYAYDLKNSELISTKAYNNIIGDIFSFDHEGDGFPELSGLCGAPENNKESHADYPLHDHSAWLMIFNNELQLTDSTLKEFGPINTRIRPFPKEINGKMEIAGTISHNLNPNDVDYTFHTENLTKIHIVDTVPKIRGLSRFEPYYIGTNGEYGIVGTLALAELVFFSEDLTFKKSLSLEMPGTLLQPFDIEGNQAPEVIIKEINTRFLTFYNLDGKRLTRTEFPVLSTIMGQGGSTNFTGTKKAYWHVTNTIVFFDLKNNPWYYLRWILLIAIISAFHLLTYLNKIIQERQAKQKNIIAEKMRKLELQTISSQLDPHFTFNSLNVLRFLADEGDNHGVEQFVKHFSKLLRQQIQSSDKPAHKLSEELSIIHHYIHLQKLRYEAPIELDLIVDSEVDQNLLIPKMLIHTHVENAIKHGLLPTGKGGTIRLNIYTDKKETLISVRDNGVGRKVGAEPDMEYNHGKGTIILDQLIELFFKLNKVKITQRYIDHKNEKGEADGTEVMITVSKK